MPDSVSTLEETGTETTASGVGADSADISAPQSTDAGDLLEDSLVEEVSIDGMCGVY